MHRLPMAEEDYDLADLGAELSEDDAEPPDTEGARASRVAHYTALTFVQRRAAEAQSSPRPVVEQRVRHVQALVRAARNLRDQQGELFIHHWTALFAALSAFRDWEL